MNGDHPKKASDRGNPAGFDPVTGEVFGSGAGAGGNDDSNEDYDRDAHGREENGPKSQTGPQ
jgi:hypothetical protein